MTFVAGVLAASAAATDEYHVIPYDVDPPIQVDAHLDDWSAVPNVIILRNREQATYGHEHWRGPDDLSGTVRLAWRAEGVAIAAEVTDDVVQQPYTGGQTWNGDHVNVWFDWTPGAEPQRNMLGRGQVHVGLSPGNFAAGEQQTPPEICIFRPEGLPTQGGQIAARRTDRGYVMEAFVPFSRLGVADVAMNQDANFEVALGDSDERPAALQTFVTRQTQAWIYSRERFRPVVFGDGNGQGSAPARGRAIAETFQVPPQKQHDLEFSVERIPPDKHAYLFFKARVHYAQPAGFVVGALALSLNGKPVEGNRIANRPMSSTSVAGAEYTQIDRDGGINVWFSPDFSAVDSSASYALLGGVRACEYEFDVTGLLSAGRNVLTFRNPSLPLPDVDRTAHVADVTLRFRPPPPPEPPPRPAPTGEIPLIEPGKPTTAFSEMNVGVGAVRFTVRGREFSVTSEFSAPDGTWRPSSAPPYEHKREVIPHNEWIEVRDTFVNLTGQNVPVMQAHRCRLAPDEKSIKVWLSGLRNHSGRGRAVDPGNPSVFGASGEWGVGLIALNDEFRVHVEAAAQGGEVSLGDYSFVLAPGGRYTAEWAIVPADGGDFWGFINAGRRLMGMNFPLKWCSAWTYKREPVYEWSDDFLRNFAAGKGANLLIQSLYGVMYKGQPARATAWMKGEHSHYRDYQKKVHRLYPDGSVKTAIYFHCFLDVWEENATRFAADRGLDSAGEHISYGSGESAMMKVYIPTMTNGWGREIARWIDMNLDDIGADGIYWDEFSYSKVPYVYNMHDGCSADIDRSTGRIERLKGSQALLSREWRAAQVKRILDRGAPFIINGAPYTRTLAALKFQAHTETGSIANCAHMLLHSPVALGDHLTERQYEDSYRTMLRALDYGCLYVWYTHIFHKGPAPTAYYYPFTPIELHGGYVIGQERIITKTSGLFGWGDDSEFTAHVFDRQGRETQEIKIPRISRNGKSFAEARLAEGCMAIIVRRTR